MNKLKKSQMFSPCYLTEDFLSLCLSLFISHPLFTHGVMLRWLWERPGWDTLFAFLSPFGSSPLCGLGHAKKWPCGKLGCDLLKQQHLPAWLLGLLLLLHGKCEAAIPMSANKLFYVYLRAGACIYGVIAAWLTCGVATSWLPCCQLVPKAVLCAFSLCWWCYAGTRSLLCTLVLLLLRDHSSTVHVRCCNDFLILLLYPFLQLWRGKKILELFFRISP